MNGTMSACATVNNVKNELLIHKSDLGRSSMPRWIVNGGLKDSHNWSNKQWALARQ